MIQLFVVDERALHGQVADVQVLSHIQLGGDGQLLVHAGHPKADGLLGALDVDRVAVDQIFPFVGLVRAGHDLDEGAFPRAVFPAQGVDLTLPHVEGNAVQGAHAGEGLHDVPKLHDHLFMCQCAKPPFRPEGFCPANAPKKTAVRQVRPCQAGESRSQKPRLITAAYFFAS